MLELQNITKVYHVGDIKTEALNGISVAFREKEFVAILGASGSGKTTCLNIIGGLDRYDSGDLIIKGKRTKDFKDRDWDAYRNNSIGFVFQNYNLIHHLSIVANVEMSMTLSGVSSSAKHKRALEVLTQVGLADHLHKKPNQLSGGQMQRVAIARALANDPEILLCDEPTGALDSVTSRQIMDLIQEVSRERLVIMVTHNKEIAERYADRIIQFEDGKITSDSNPYDNESKESGFNLKKTSMNFLTALNISLQNIRTKKFRTFLTSFASSIGIIGIAVILSLSTGFQTQIDKFESDAMAEFPIIISQSVTQVDREEFANMNGGMGGFMGNQEEFVDSDEVYLYDTSKAFVEHENKLNDVFMAYIKGIDTNICSNIGYTRAVAMNWLRKTDDSVVPVKMPGGLMGGGSGGMGGISSMSGLGLSSYPDELNAEPAAYLQRNYDLLSGQFPTRITDLVLVIDNKNRLDVSIVEELGFDTDDVESIKFNDFIGKRFKIIDNNDYYIKTDMGNFIPGSDYSAMYDSDQCLEAEIVGIVRAKEGTSLSMLGSGICYSDKLTAAVVEKALQSDIVKAQKDADHNVMTMEKFEDEATKNYMIKYLGGDASPVMLMIYPTDFTNKDKVIEYLDAYNQKQTDAADEIIYTDLAGTVSRMTSGIMDAITIVLVAFAAISLVVSMIMICIITYTSVLERTKEIGILKALGARKKDITRVFDAETCLLGIFSGLLGVGIAYLLTIPINMVIENLSGLSGTASLQPLHALILVITSTVITVIGGYIPAKIASKKDAVEALRAE